MSIEQKLYPIEIEEIRDIGKGDNVSLIFQKFKKGHCLLIGPYSRALFLIPLSSKANLGGSSSYLLCKDKKTKYLNELKPGDELLTMNSNGEKSYVIVEKSETKPMPILYISGRHRISGNDIFKLIESSGDDYFNIYRRIFHLKERKTEKPIHVLDIHKYENKKRDICAYLDIAVVVPDLNAKYKAGDKLMAYIQMPGNSRHFGYKYDGSLIEV